MRRPLLRRRSRWIIRRRSRWGLCVDCGRDGKFSPAGWHYGLHAVGPLLPRYQNEPIIEYGKRPRFDWKYGLVGEMTPDKVLAPAVEPVDLLALLAELEAAGSGAVTPEEGADPVAPRNANSPTAFLSIQKGQGVLKIPVSFEQAWESPSADKNALPD